MRTSDWVKFSHVWWESVPQRFPKQTMQSLKGSSVVFPPIKNMYAKIAHTPDTVHDGMPGTSHDCIVHHYTAYHFLDMHCCTYCKKRWPAIWLHRTRAIDSLHVQYPKKTSKMYRRGWENKQNARRLYAMSGGNGCTKDLWSPHHRGRLVWTHPESKVSCACCTGSMLKKHQPTINTTLTISPRPCIAHLKSSYFVE